MPEINNSKTEPLDQLFTLSVTTEMDAVLKKMAFDQSMPGYTVLRQDVIRQIIEASPGYRAELKSRKYSESSV